MSLSQPSHRYFTLEGNIGCGKSTFLKIVEQHFPQVHLIPEPVQEWRNVNNTGVNILQSYYEDSPRWGLTFLNYALFTRLRGYQASRESYPHSTIISQRSPLSDKFVFFELMKELGTLNQTETVLFSQIYEGQEKISRFERPRIIYLRSTPQLCKERTEKRHRSEQASIPLSYFQKLHQKHERWMWQQKKEDVLMIDTSVEFERDEGRTQEIVSLVREFLEKKD